MCGIAGIIGTREHKQAVIKDMLTLMHSRGPDARSVKTINEATLGAVRLRITDHQNMDADMPLSSYDGRYMIVFNGEIYNFKALRQQLSDYPFQTNCDTEVLLAAYMVWGEECLHKLRGMFSFCIYDMHTKQAFLAVDPTGQKPLYYSLQPDGLYFASDIEALIRTPDISKEWDMHAIAQAIGIMFIFGGDTHIRQIKKLESGCFLRFSAQTAQFTTQRYYTLPIQHQSELSANELHELKEAIFTAAEQSCKNCFHTEVPYAHLLSGGIDSSSVVAFAKQFDLDLSTYAIGLVNPNNTNDINYNEFEYSRYIADYFGTRHTEISLSPAEYCSYLERWSAICSEPHGAPEAASLYALFQHISDDGFRVAFSGNGPDEIFDGYGHGNILQSTPIHQLSTEYFNRFNGIASIDLQRLLPDINALDSFTHAMDPILDVYREDCDDAAQLACAMNFHGIYPACEFRQIDQTSMAHSIEVRSPLAELDLIEQAFHTPSLYKYYKDCEKWIFKEALCGLLPEKIIHRKKAGFPISQTIYSTSEFNNLISPILEPGSALDKIGIINMNYLRDLRMNGSPAQQNIFYRLYILNTILNRQSTYL